jgi:hypothetical protein
MGAEQLPTGREGTGVSAFVRQPTSEVGKPVTETAERAATSAGRSLDDVQPTLAEKRTGWSDAL